jgi:superfamily II DNA or RNA helicase
LPSDLGFSDDGFILPALNENDHIVRAETLPDGMLFQLPAFGLSEEREERKRTIKERCGYVAELVAHDRPAVVWCHTNAEGDMLERIIPGARQVAGRTPDEEKEAHYKAFTDGTLRVLVIKPKIGAWGLNWQHCARMAFVGVTDSFEAYYQAVRRCWRFGQKRDVHVHIFSSAAEGAVAANLKRKERDAMQMAESLSQETRGAVIASVTGTTRQTNTYAANQAVSIPSFLFGEAA